MQWDKSFEKVDIYHLIAKNLHKYGKNKSNKQNDLFLDHNNNRIEKFRFENMGVDTNFVQF